MRFCSLCIVILLVTSYCTCVLWTKNANAKNNPSRQLQYQEIESKLGNLRTWGVLKVPKSSVYLDSTTTKDRAMFIQDYLAWYFDHPASKKQTVSKEELYKHKVPDRTMCISFAKLWWQKHIPQEVLNEESCQDACLDAFEAWKQVRKSVIENFVRKPVLDRTLKSKSERIHFGELKAGPNMTRLMPVIDISQSHQANKVKTNKELNDVYIQELNERFKPVESIFLRHQQEIMSPTKLELPQKKAQ